MPPADPAGRRLLVLGGGRHQTALIRRAEARGIATVVADYYPDAPGKAHATFPTDTDALDIDANIAIAEEYGVSGVITTGTDMAVVTMARVAAALDLPCYLSAEAAVAATHKEAMAQAFATAGVRRARLVTVNAADDAAEAAERIEFPVVVKPADSQGQRGTTKVDDRGEITAAVALALDSSREGTAVIEEFATGFEVTASAWVDSGTVHILTLADRVTYNPPPAIGIAVQHVFPSLRAKGMLEEIESQSRAVAGAYGMQQGPLYIQMLLTPGGIIVVEAGARVGGGHEASLIPLVTGVDVTDRLIDLALDGACAPAAYDYADTIDQTHALVNFLVARPGKVASLEGFAALRAEGAIAEGGFYVQPGYEQAPIINSLGRVGYFLASASSREELLEGTKRAFEGLSMVGADGTNLLFWPEPQWVNG